MLSLAFAFPNLPLLPFEFPWVLETTELEQKYTTLVNQVPYISGDKPVTPQKETIINKQTGVNLKASVSAPNNEVATKTSKLTLQADTTIANASNIRSVPRVYVKVWNKSTDDKDSYKWQLMDKLTNVESFTAVYDIVGGTPDYNTKQIGLVNGINEIGYAFMAENGAVTENTIFIDSSDTLADVTVDTVFSPMNGIERDYSSNVTQRILDSRNGYNLSVSSDRPADYLLISDAYNFLPDKTTAEREEAYKTKQDILALSASSERTYSGSYWNDIRERMKNGTTPKLLRNGDYYMTAMDQYGGLSIKEFTIDDIDNRAPEAAKIDVNGSEYVITATAVQADDVMRVKSAYNPDYIELKPSDHSFEQGKLGMYSVEITQNADFPSLYDYRVVGYGSPENSYNMNAIIRDKAGNEALTKSGYTGDAPISCTSIEYKNDSVVATFSQPVIMTCLGQEKRGYQREFDNLPIFNDGNQTITYVDLYGKSYTQTLTDLNISGAAFRCAVDISELSPTQNDVVVTINTMLNGKLVIDSVTAENGDVQFVTNGGNKKMATITMTDNGTISYKLTNGTSIERTIKIDNIDRTAPVGRAEFSYADTVTDGHTKGEIYVTLFADEEIDWISDGAVHTFSYGNVADHVFRYRDLAGNEGTTTVKCPVVIDKKPILTNDETPPSFTFAVNSITNGVHNSVGSFGEGFDAKELPAFNQTLELVFDITDENTVTLTCPGAEVSGTAVRIKANGSFNVTLVDTAGNITNVPLNITSFDNTKIHGNSKITGEMRFSAHGKN